MILDSAWSYDARVQDAVAGQRVWMTDVDWPGIEVLGGVALDPAGNAYVVGSFPSDAFGFQTEGFLAKVDRAGVVQ